MKKIAIFFTIILVVGCSSIPLYDVYEKLYGPSFPQERVLTAEEVNPQARVSFSKKVQPILDKRCNVCHSCNDAPCQLNLTSIEGIDRGATTAPVYNGARFFQQAPTRLGIDAQTTSGWREKGFTPVLNERRQNEQINLDNSLLYRAIALKRRNPLPTEGRLSADYNIGADLKHEESFLHQQTCPTMETFSRFELNHPQWGMPFALPGLSREEFKTIETWLEQGGRVEATKKLPQAIENEVAKWEDFLNKPSNKVKLMSRYLYEHLFIGHIYFNDVSETDFFMLVRSRTPPGEKIDIIPSVRPYNEPGVTKFYYRLDHYNRTIVDKTHMPYAFNDKRMVRFKTLFLEPDYEVSELPSYEKAVAANPFKTFAAIPSISRYKFMLDDAHYFISGFIKGPVCRGSIALSVIDDHFWVLFMNPDRSYISHDSAFLERVSNNLRIPSEKEDKARVFSVWATYEAASIKYYTEKVKYIREKYPEHSRRATLEDIWNGDKVNKNAALTVYRHYDSATVLKGLVGEIPKTGLIIDYPIFERIHYLLVAGFNVYDTLGHQLSTRLYADFLRIEMELQFLIFFPTEEKIKMHRHWYRGTNMTDKILRFIHDFGGTREPDIDYHTDDVKAEFFVKVYNHLGASQQDFDYINLCTKFITFCKTNGFADSTTRIQNALRKLTDIKGEITSVFPNVTFLRVKVDGSVDKDLVYTIVRNKSYLNTTSLGQSEKNHIRSEDTIDIVEGFVGAYPNFFLEIDYYELDAFVAQYAAIDSFEKYEILVNRFGIRRTNPDFWKSADWFYEKYKHDNPVSAGLFDLARYKNR